MTIQRQGNGPHMFIYADNSNVFIEGKKFAAVKNGLASSIHDANQNKIQDPSWRLDFGELLECCGGYLGPVAKAVLYGSRPPSSDKLWQQAEDQGFTPYIMDRNSAGKEKGLDNTIVADAIDDYHEYMQPGDHVVLITGDGDYIPLARLVERGLILSVYSWSHCLAASLRSVASRTVELDSFYERITLQP